MTIGEFVKLLESLAENAQLLETAAVSPTVRNSTEDGKDIKVVSCKVTALKRMATDLIRIRDELRDGVIPNVSLIEPSKE